MESKRNENKKDEQTNKNSMDIGKNMQIEIYDKSGRKLNLSVCNEDIKIMKYIGDIEELNLESAANLASKGIDVFNSSDKFFNNICHNYNNTDRTDITIDDRRSDIYQNVSFCQSGCTYTGMNYELMTANCICDCNIIQNELDNNTENNNTNDEGNNFNSITKSMLANLLDFNIDVIKCYNLIMDLKIMKSNIGFYSTLTPFILQIIFLFVYISKKLNSIKYFILNYNNKNNNNNKNIINNKNKINDKKKNKNNKKFSPAFPPPKNNSFNHNKNENSKNNKIINNDKYIGHKKKKGKKIQNNKKNFNLWKIMIMPIII